MLAAFTILWWNPERTEFWKPYANRGTVCSLKTYQWCGEPCFADAQFQKMRVCRKLLGWVGFCQCGSNECFWRINLMLALSRSLLKTIPSYLHSRTFRFLWSSDNYQKSHAVAPQMVQSADIQSDRTKHSLSIMLERPFSGNARLSADHKWDFPQVLKCL
jgi:hypothetical protein